MNKTVTLLERIEFFLLSASVVSIVLVVLPIFSNPFNTGKLVLGGILVGALYIVKVIRKVMSNNPSITVSNFDVPVILLVASFLASSLISTPNKLESFWLPGVSSFVVLGSLVYFASTQLSAAKKQLLAQVLIVIASIVAFFSLLEQVGILRSMTFLPSIFQAASFNPTGSVLAAATLMIISIPLALQNVMHGDMVRKAIFGTCLTLISLGLVVNLLTMLQPNKVNLPGFGVSWVVATESLKAKPLFGVGPGNYISAFSRYLPLSYNTRDTWSLRFPNAQNYYFTVLSENGLFGIAVLLLILFVTYQTLKKTKEHAIGRYSVISLVLLLVVLMFVPAASPVIIVLLMMMMAFASRSHTVHFGFDPSSDKSALLKAPLLAVGIPTIIAICAVFFFGIKFAIAEHTYFKAISAVAKNDGRAAYDLMRSAINMTPYIDRYHRSYAQLNLALANSVAQNKELSAEDKNTVSQLIQQAIREGKSGVALNLERANSWEVLASIYRTIIPLAQGADQFAIQSYSQAIILDPTNPNLRIALGGIFYSAKRYEDAIDVFKYAVIAHPKFANGYYNLALAYRDAGQTDRALATMNQLITILPKDTDDYRLAQKEIDNLKSNQPKKDADATQNLTPPQTAQEELDPKITLPEDAVPPATPVATTTPAPSATPTPTVSASPTSTPTPIP